MCLISRYFSLFSCSSLSLRVKLVLNPGVNDVNIDLRQQKVVVTGNVNSDILIRKLASKTGKLVELWPEQPDSKKKQGKPEKQKDPVSSEEGINQSDQNDTKINQGDQNDNEKGKGKAKVVVDSAKNVQATGNTSKNGDGCGGVNVNVNKPNEGCATGKIGTVQIQEPKPGVRQTVVLPAGPVLEKKVSVAVQFPNENEESANEKTVCASNGGKKKKKKGKVNNNNGNEDATGTSTPTVTMEHCGDAPATGGLGSRSYSQSHVTHVHGQVPANVSPPRHHVYQQYAPHYYAPPAPAPVCTVSYNTAYPSSSSYGAAYYAPPQPYSYAHVVQPGTEMEPRPPPFMYESESYSYAPSQPSDSFVFFSDENPNACSVM